MNLFFHHAVQNDLNRSIRYLEREGGTGLGDRFFADLRASLLSAIRKLSLVPKLHLGTHLSWKLHFLCQAVRTKYNFADNGIPKCNLGTRERRERIRSLSFSLMSPVSPEMQTMPAKPGEW